MDSTAVAAIDRARDLVIHGPAHRGANGAAMPTDEGDQGSLFFFNHNERGGYSTAYARKPYCCCTPPLRGGGAAPNGHRKRLVD